MHEIRQAHGSDNTDSNFHAATAVIIINIHAAIMSQLTINITNFSNHTELLTHKKY